MGENGDPATPTCGPALRKCISVRGDLPGARNGRGYRIAMGEQRRPHHGLRGLERHKQTRHAEKITPILLTSRAPELNPVDNIWQYMRANWLSNRVFDNYDAIIEAICEAWNNLMVLPDTIKSMGKREWAHADRSG